MYPNLFYLQYSITIVFAVFILFWYAVKGHQYWDSYLKPKLISFFKIISNMIKIIILPIIVVVSITRLNYKIYEQYNQKKIKAKLRYIAQVESKLQTQIQKNQLLEHQLTKLEQKLNLMIKHGSFNQLIDVKHWQKFKRRQLE
jgi:hypothetical protein